MSITTEFFSYQNNKSVAGYEGIPSSTNDCWYYEPKQGVYVTNRFFVTVKQNTIGLQLILFGGYLRCCGMREVGAIEFSGVFTNAHKAALVKELFDDPWFKTMNVGSLLYTKVKTQEDVRLYRDGWDFIEHWPGTVTEGGWWYNPNSGHYCCNVTLSFDAKPLTYSDEEEEEE